jgi:hypothetical protein
MSMQIRGLTRDAIKHQTNVRQMKMSLLLGLVLVVSYLPTVDAATPESLNLGDCRILSGKLRAKAYKEVMDRYRKDAETGNIEARKALANIANNKFACRLENYSDNAGWTIVEEGDKNGVVSSSSSTVPVETFKKDAVTMKALKEAYQSAHSLADDDVAYRRMAAAFVADYKEAFEEEYADAYRDAVGAREVACRFPQAIDSKTDTELLCTMARASAATLYPLLSKDRRAALEQEAGAWVEGYVRKAKSR